MHTDPERGRMDRAYQTRDHASGQQVRRASRLIQDLRILVLAGLWLYLPLKAFDADAAVVFEEAILQGGDLVCLSDTPDTPMPASPAGPTIGIILSGHDEEQTALEALREGVHGYLVKGSGTDLGKAICAIHREEVWTKRQVLATVTEELDRLADLTFPAAEGEPSLA